MSDRAPPTKAVPPVPPHFVEHFVAGGWREVERVYGCRTALMMTWIELCGGLAKLQQRRRDWQAKKRAEAKAAVARGKIQGQRTEA